MRFSKFLFVALFLLSAAGTAFAQSADETRTVGRKGARQLSLSFATMTSIQETPEYDDYYGTYGTTSSTTTTMYGNVGIGRFLTESFVLSTGISGSGSVGGGGSANFMGYLGFVYYTTPQKVSSLYLGGDMSASLTSTGSMPQVLGKVGVQTAIKANASLFLEGAYGGALDSFSNGSLQTQVGLRVLF